MIDGGKYFETHADDGVGQASDGTKLIEELQGLLRGRAATSRG